MLLIIHLSYIFLIQPLLEARAEIQKYFRWFLVQMKSLEFAFEINWPLVVVQRAWVFSFDTVKVYYIAATNPREDDFGYGVLLPTERKFKNHRYPN